MNRNNTFGGGAPQQQASSGVRTLEVNHKPLVILRCKVIVIGKFCTICFNLEYLSDLLNRRCLCW
jgi:hypothetical protein